MNISSQNVRDVLTLIDWLGQTKAPTNRAREARERLELLAFAIAAREEAERELVAPQTIGLIGDAQGGGHE